MTNKFFLASITEFYCNSTAVKLVGAMQTSSQAFGAGKYLLPFLTYLNYRSGNSNKLKVDLSFHLPVSTDRPNFLTLSFPRIFLSRSF